VRLDYIGWLPLFFSGNFFFPVCVDEKSHGTTIRSVQDPDGGDPGTLLRPPWGPEDTQGSWGGCAKPGKSTLCKHQLSVSLLCEILSSSYSTGVWLSSGSVQALAPSFPSPSLALPSSQALPLSGKVSL
jgi:hypothetical protein